MYSSAQTTVLLCLACVKVEMNNIWCCPFIMNVLWPKHRIEPFYLPNLKQHVKKLPKMNQAWSALTFGLFTLSYIHLLSGSLTSYHYESLTLKLMNDASFMSNINHIIWFDSGELKKSKVIVLHKLHSSYCVAQLSVSRLPSYAISCWLWF